MDTRVLKKTVGSSAVFTVAPAVAILLGVIALSRALGFPLPWLRLSVIGALTYETTAAAITPTKMVLRRVRFSCFLAMTVWMADCSARLLKSSCWVLSSS